MIEHVVAGAYLVAMFTVPFSMAFLGRPKWLINFINRHYFP